jgi:hypothetical protein
MQARFYYVPPRETRAMWFAFERRWLLAVLAAILPSGSHARLHLGARDVPLARFVADLLARAPVSAVLALRASLWVATLAPLVRGRLRTFGALPPAEQVETLRALERSRLHLLREVPVLLKTLACLGFCGLPEVQRQAGIEPVAAAPPRWARE